MAYGLSALMTRPQSYGGTTTLVPPYMASIYDPMTQCFVPIYDRTGNQASEGPCEGLRVCLLMVIGAWQTL